MCPVVVGEDATIKKHHPAAKMLEIRPWGSYQILYEDSTCKVKKIVVNPGLRLSLQSHQKRDEFWILVSGQAIVTLEDQQLSLVAGQSICIPNKAKHRIANGGSEPLVFLETQTGSYFGEDDIIRYQDDFGR